MVLNNLYNLMTGSMMLVGRIEYIVVLLERHGLSFNIILPDKKSSYKKLGVGGSYTRNHLKRSIQSARENLV